LHQNSNRANAALFSAALNGCFRLLEQREHLRVRTIRIPRGGGLATRTHVFAGSAQNRTNYGLVGREFTGRRRIISNSKNDNLVLTTAKGKKQKRSPFLKVSFDELVERAPHAAIKTGTDSAATAVIIR
jgi:hypothetical protein